MKKISIEDINKEMVLAEDVHGSQGNVLINKGTKLTVAMGRRLKNWGIDSVYVEGEQEQVEQEPSIEISSEDIKKNLKIKFADHLNNPIMRELCEAVYEFKNITNSK